MRPQPACWICLHSLLVPLSLLLTLLILTTLTVGRHVKFMQTNSHAKWGPEDKCIASAAPWIRTVLRMVTTSCSFRTAMKTCEGEEGHVECGSGRHVLANGSPQSAHTLQLLIRRIYVCIRLWQGRATLQLNVPLSKPLIVPHSDSLSKVYFKRICRNILHLCPDNESFLKEWLFQTGSRKLWTSKCQLA